MNDVPYIDLGLDLDLDKLKSECNSILTLYNTANYNSSFYLARKKYRKAWSGISLWGSDGNLYSDFTEGDI